MPSKLLFFIWLFEVWTPFSDQNIMFFSLFLIKCLLFGFCANVICIYFFLPFCSFSSSPGKQIGCLVQLLSMYTNPMWIKIDSDRTDKCFQLFSSTVISLIDVNVCLISRQMSYYFESIVSMCFRLRNNDFTLKTLAKKKDLESQQKKNNNNHSITAKTLKS